MFSKFKQKLQDLPVAIKVTLWYTIFLGIIFAAIMAFTVKYTEGMRLSLAHENLRENIEETVEKPHKFHAYDDGVYMVQYDVHNVKLRGRTPAGMPELPPQFTTPEIQIVKSGSQEFHYYDVKLRNNTWLRGVISINKTMQRSQRYLLRLLIMLPLFMLIAAIGGYKIIKRGFKPVKQISATVKAIGTTADLSTRINIGPGQDEIHTMAQTFNNMLDKIQGSVQREKQFSADVSHELRTPVAVIMSESEFGKDYTETVEDAKASFTSIFKQAQNMTALINHILELARMKNSNNSTLPQEEINFSDLVSSTLQTYEALAENKNIKLSATVTPMIAVQGNLHLLQRVLPNLLDNALKFTTDTIFVTLTATQEKALLRVQDNGKGIAPADLPKIWDRLYQANSARHKDDNSGLGLGLSFVVEIARLHQGRVYADSTLGVGSIFSLELPLKS